MIASGPISRVLCGACCHAPRRSFLWAADHSTAQAAYPRVLTGRAGPPLLFGLAPRGACRAAGITACAVGSYPTFSPLPCAAVEEDLPKVWPPADHRCRRTGGLFSVALSVAVPSPAQPPGVTRRAALRSPDFPPGFTLRHCPAITRPARSFYYNPAAPGNSSGGSLSSESAAENLCRLNRSMQHHLI